MGLVPLIFLLLIRTVFTDCAFLVLWTVFRFIRLHQADIDIRNNLLPHTTLSTHSSISNIELYVFNFQSKCTYLCIVISSIFYVVLTIHVDHLFIHPVILYFRNMHVNIVTEGLINREHLLLLYLHNTKITYRCVHCINPKSILYDINIFLKLKLFHSDHAINVPIYACIIISYMYPYRKCYCNPSIRSSHNILSTYKTTDVSECTSIKNELFLSTFIFFRKCFVIEMFILVISDSSEINEYISILCVLSLYNTSLKKLCCANDLFTLLCYMSIVSFIYRFQAATMLTINHIVYCLNLMGHPSFTNLHPRSYPALNTPIHQIIAIICMYYLSIINPYSYLRNIFTIYSFSDPLRLYYEQNYNRVYVYMYHPMHCNVRGISICFSISQNNYQNHITHTAFHIFMFYCIISMYGSSTGPADKYLFTSKIISFSEIYKHLNYINEIIRQKLSKFLNDTHFFIQVFHHPPLTLTPTQLSVHSCKPCDIAWNTVGAINSLLSTITETKIVSYFRTLYGTLLTLSGIASLCNYVFISISVLNAIIRISWFLLITHLDIETIRPEIMFSILKILYTVFARCHDSIYAMTIVPSLKMEVFTVHVCTLRMVQCMCLCTLPYILITLTRANYYKMFIYYERTHSPLRKTIKKADVLIQLIYVLVFTHPYHITQIYNCTKICLLSYKVYFHGKFTFILMFLVLKLYSLFIFVVFINSFKGPNKLIQLVITPYSEKLSIVRIHDLKRLQIYAQYQLLYLSQYIRRYYLRHDLILCGSQFDHLYGEKRSRWDERIIHFNFDPP